MFSGFASFLDLLEAFHRHLPGQLEVRARRRPEPEHELPRIDLREQLGSHLQPQLPEHQGTRRQIDRHHHPAQADEPAHELAINLEKPIEQPRLRVAMPVTAWCFSSATHRIGTNVLESRYDAIMANPTPRVSGMNSDRSGSSMMNAGMNTDRMHSKASSRGTAVALLACSTAVASFGVRAICTCTFSIVTVALSTRMPIASAMPPSDMMLIVLPVIQSPNNDPRRRQRDVGHDDDHAPHVAQEQEDHQPGQARADQPLGRHALDGRHHGGRLVELEVDLHVLGNGIAKRLHRLVDVGDDGQRRSRIFLDDRQIDRLLAVNKCVSVSDVGIIL